MSETVYVKANQMIRAVKPEICIGDLGDIWCADPAMLARCRSLRLFTMYTERRICSIADVIQTINGVYPQAVVESVGEADFIIEYKPQANQNRSLEWVKFALVWIVIVCGAAFAILTFNEDVSVAAIFALIHEALTGEARERLTWLEGGYALGLGGGILIFYSHLTRRKEISDPTPLDAEMRAYEKELYTTMIENAAREKQQEKTGAWDNPEASQKKSVKKQEKGSRDV